MRPALCLPLARCLMLASLAACANGQANRIADRTPGLDVADVALANGSPETALHVAQHILANRPNDVPAMVRQGEAEAMLRRNQEARAAFEQALAIAPDNSDALLGLGRLELATDPAAAAALFGRLTTREPRNVAALTDLGIANDLQGRHAEAQTEYRLALAIEPGRSAISVNLGLSLALSGDPQAAIAILRPLAQSPGAQPRLRQDLAVALALAGDNDEATRLLHTDMPQAVAMATVQSYRALMPVP